MASAAELSFNWTGFISAMVSNLTFGFRAVLGKKCAPGPASPAPGGISWRHRAMLVYGDVHMLLHISCIALCRRVAVRNGDGS